MRNTAPDVRDSIFRKLETFSRIGPADDLSKKFNAVIPSQVFAIDDASSKWARDIAAQTRHLDAGSLRHLSGSMANWARLASAADPLGPAMRANVSALKFATEFGISKRADSAGLAMLANLMAVSQPQQYSAGISAALGLSPGAENLKRIADLGLMSGPHDFMGRYRQPAALAAAQMALGGQIDLRMLDPGYGGSTWKKLFDQWQRPSRVAAAFELVGNIANAKSPLLLEALGAAARSIPNYMRPMSAERMLLPSWQIAAGFGSAGLAPPNLVHDILTTMYRDRPTTIAFEAAVKIVEESDNQERDFSETSLSFLQNHIESLLEVLFSAKDYVTFQGILQTVTLVLLILNWYDGNISRHNSEQQTKIAREQLAISRAAEPLAVTPIQLEIADRIKSVESKITNIGKKLEVPEDIRQVIRDAPLRVEPDPSATIIRRVYADGRLRL